MKLSLGRKPVLTVPIGPNAARFAYDTGAEPDRAWLILFSHPVERAPGIAPRDFVFAGPCVSFVCATRDRMKYYQVLHQWIDTANRRYRDHEHQTAADGEAGTDAVRRAKGLRGGRRLA
jgi:hypothetical protein